MEKENGVQILSIAVTPSPVVIMGLGSDGAVYQWDYDCSWKLKASQQGVTNYLLKRKE